MAYIKNEWKARQGAGLNRFRKSGETEEFIYLDNEPDQITEPGTSFSSERMNCIEDGIYAAHNDISTKADKITPITAVTAPAAKKVAYNTQGQITNTADLTKSDVGLGSVTNNEQVKRSEMGAVEGVATLDEEGKVPMSQLPEAFSGDLGEVLLAIKELQEGQRANIADMVDGLGRDLLEVLGVSTIPEAMAELRRRFNNNGEIDSTKTPDFRGLMVGDYLDGIDFSGITPPTSAQAPNGGPAAWNDTYKNNRLVIAGFNTYKQAGNTENTDNHILFIFRNVLWQQRQRAGNTNAGGYTNPTSEIRAYLEGVNGDGNGTFAIKLEECLNGGVLPPGGKYLYTIRKCNSTKNASAWNLFTVFLPTEIEVFGFQALGDELSPNYPQLNIHFPLYQKSTVYRCKRYNGARAWHWLSTPRSSSSTDFCLLGSGGGVSYFASSTANGGSPPVSALRKK
jgi:hypothetical protein